MKLPFTYYEGFICNLPCSNPNGKLIDFYWKSYTLDEPCYMQFDDPLEMKEGRFHEDRSKIWIEILQLIENSKRNVTHLE